MSQKNKLHENVIKASCILLLGITIPNISGLINNSAYTPFELVASYSYFILIAFIIWQGNVYLMLYFRKKLNWRNNEYYKTFTILVLSTILYSGTVSYLLLLGWNLFSKENFTGMQTIANASFIIIVAAAFISNVHEIIYLNNERENNLSRAERLNIANIQAELEILKNQTDPHFLFNSLNTLSFLISKDADSAKHFTNTLANVYRYILLNKEKDFVLLKEEIEFISNYFYLLKIRFGTAINMVIEINDVDAEDFLIPPISLQVLVENAIKHNEFNEKNPMEISVSILSNQVVIKNIVRKKEILPNSTKTGLKNLNYRYQYLTRKNIVTENVNNLFIARLPILKF